MRLSIKENSSHSGTPFSCFLIGGTSLLIHCGEILLNSGNRVCGIVSSDQTVIRWAKDHAIKTISARDDFETFLKSVSFDYLFSIVNEHILSNEVLQLPSKYSINYHDAPLPKYAGTHATSWALLNQETSHGVTWHVIDEQVDGGDILKQRSVAISANETAFTLNTKCYEAAINSFAELVNDLSSGGTGRKQKLAERTFFPRYKRPAAGGVLSWKRPAKEIAATVRALNFGPQPNPLGSAKSAIGGNFLLVSEIEVLEALSANEPGTVVTVCEDSVTVATTTSDVELRNLATIDGQRLTIKELVERYGLAEGKRFDELNADTLLRIEKFNAECCKHESFWVKRLASLQPPDLPYTHRTTRKTAPLYQSRLMVLPEEISRLLPAQDETCICADFLLAAWAAYLCRIANADHFDLGLKQYALWKDFNGLQSLFASHVPLQVELTNSQTLPDFFSTLKAQLAVAREHYTYMRDVPGRYPNIRSQGGGNHFLPVTVQVVESLDVDAATAETELTLLIAQDGRACRWLYDPGALEADSIEKMIRQFRTFLHGYAADPQCPIARLPLLSEEELQQVLVQWNATDAEVSQQKCIHHLFESQVERTPDGLAVIFDQESLTYRQLNQRANQLARRLRKLGVGAETLVGICLSRSLALVTGLLGILKAGGAYVPLDSAYPRERLAFIVEDTAVSVIVTHDELLAKLPSHRAHLVCLDSDRNKIAEEFDGNLSGGADAENLAYLIYTSGSTGQPKGVAIEHRSTVTLIEWAQTIFTSEELSGVLASTSICFDLSVFEIFVPLSCGGTVILAENALHLPALPSANRVSLVNTVPSAMAELIRMKRLPVSVRTINLAGEPLQTSLVQQIYQQSNVQKVFDLYGPSEDTTYSTFALRRASGPATIGRPIANTQVYLLDRNLQPVPIGVPGEIYLGGAGLARGYLNRPKLTNERFVQDPFSSKSGARLYKTGDLARFFSDGNLEYLGRLDHQVKVRGFRIELGEIEAVLNQHPMVRDSVVLTHEDNSGVKNLAAYVVPQNGQSPTTLELREFLKEKLPQFMVPSFLMMLECMPLTPNGKVDRRALPEPESSGNDLRETFVAPRNPLEQELVKTWEEILKTQPIGVKDNFFELGGHSLLAVEIFVRIESRYGKQLPLATLFQAPTIEQLASLLREGDENGSLSSLVAIQPHGSKLPFFCIHARGGNVLFYRDLSKRLGPDQPFYGLQAQGMDGKRPRHTRIEEMAAHYINEIRYVQPNGPYFLGGASFGGTAAFEMARQLHAEGEEVALLALFDTTGPGYPKLLPGTSRLRSKAYELIRRFQYQLSSLRLLERQQRANYIKRKLKKGKVAVIRGFKKRTRSIASRVPPALRQIVFSASKTAPWALLENENAIRQAVKNYVPRPYSGRLTLFRAQKQPLGIHPDPSLGWSGLVTGELEIHEVPGYHGAIVAEPHVRFLAEQLQACMAKAQREFSVVENLSAAPPELANITLTSNKTVRLQA